MLNLSISRAAILRCITAAVAFLALSSAPAPSSAGVSGDTLTESVTSGSVKLAIKVTANDRECRLALFNCRPDCKFRFTRCLDIQNITSSMQYTGSSTTMKLSYSVSIKIENKKFQATSRGFTLVNNDTVCQSPVVTGVRGDKTLDQSGAGTVCAGKYGVLPPTKVTYTINWTLTSASGSQTFGSKSWDQSLNYD